MEDGVRISVSPKNAEKFIDCAIEILIQMKIPFIELREPNLEKRVEIILAAVIVSRSKKVSLSLPPTSHLTQ